MSVPDPHRATSSSLIVASTVLRDVRERAQLTQVQLAARAGLTQSVISTYENGRREPSLAVLQRLVQAAGFTWRVELEPVAEPRSLRARVGDRRTEILDAFAELGGRNVRLFGSVARGEDGPDSDVDLMVDLAPDCGLFSLMRMQDVAERILHNRVDVVSVDAMSPRTRANALRDAVAL